MSVKIKIRRLNESKEKEVIDEYKGYITLNIRQSGDIDRTEALGFIRVIPNVTTIRREREVATSEKTYTGEFLLRIVLKHGIRFTIRIKNQRFLCQSNSTYNHTCKT